MSTSIYPCLWFNSQGQEAFRFYCGIFKDSKIDADNPMVVKGTLAGYPLMGLNGGPMFNINPSISFFVTIRNPQEMERIWQALMDGGTAMMSMDSYPWAEKYGWVKDRFGMTWQLMLDPAATEEQKIMSSLLFVGAQFGKAKEAVEQYTSIFNNSNILQMDLYKEGEEQGEGKVKFSHFTLDNTPFAAMDGPGNHDFSFNEGVSFVVECDTQEQIDYYWEHLSLGGTESQCGWLKDRFGVSWQVVPRVLSTLMSDAGKARKVTKAFMTMKKLDIEALIAAAEQS